MKTLISRFPLLTVQLRNDEETLRLKHILFFCTKAEMDAYHDMNILVREPEYSWAEQIKECQNRPQGMKVDERCQMHGITKANYYWRFRKVRKAFFEAADVTPTFVELPAPMPVEPITSAKSKVVAVLKGKNHLTLEIFSLSTRKEFVRKHSTGLRLFSFSMFIVTADRLLYSWIMFLDI